MRKKKFLIGSEVFNYKGIPFRKLSHEVMEFFNNNDEDLCEYCKFPCHLIKHPFDSNPDKNKSFRSFCVYSHDLIGCIPDL